jgi:hypothetical protein
VEFAERVPEDAVVAFVADHGTALSGQFRRPPDDWTVEEVRERMSAFFAMRAPPECLPAEPVVVQNVLRSLMACLGSDHTDELGLRMFPSSLYLVDGQRQIIELPTSTVDAVVGADS